MSLATTLLYRASSLLVTAGLVTTIIYLTPVPDPYFKSCERPCNELDWPMICRFKFILEEYQTMSGACNDCRQNISACFSRQCITGDGHSSPILTVNRMFPGPTLQVCENDIVVVDVVNRIPGKSVGMHWGGQELREFPFMDGVPGVTQCAIPPKATFQYKFRASRAGSHLWTATAIDDSGTLSGPLIVHQSPRREPHKDLYDFVQGENDIILMLNVWKDQVLVNGRASQENSVRVPYEVISGRAESRKRLRILHAGGDPTGSPVNIAIDNHLLEIIALDGSPIQSKNVSSFNLSPGERVDAVIHFDQPPDEYMVKVSLNTGDYRRLTGGAVILYENAPTISAAKPHQNETREAQLSKYNEINALEDMPDELRAPKLDNTIYLPFDFKRCNRLFSATHLTGRKLAPLDTVHVASPERANEITSTPWPQIVPRINNITFSFGYSPLLSQLEDAIAEGTICRAGEIASTAAKAAAAGDGCECLHVIDVPQGAPVEVVLVHLGGEERNHHVFQLHGNRGYFVGEGSWKNGSATADECRLLDDAGELLRRNFHRPVLKDTFSVPPLGVVSFRFIADNPGYWILHDQNAYVGSNALAVVLHVGDDSTLPPIPEDFPKCSNFIGPEFFLM